MKTKKPALKKKPKKLPVKFAFECRECECCGEPFCDECDEHYADCKHPGPHSEEDEDE